MKYYCNICKAEIYIPIGYSYTTPGCCVSYDEFGNTCGGSVDEIPDYETPQQYEERTGNKLSDNAAVWTKNEIGEWILFYYKEAKEYNGDPIVVCQSPEPPPDNWEPEE